MIEESMGYNRIALRVSVRVCEEDTRITCDKLLCPEEIKIIAATRLSLNYSVSGLIEGEVEYGDGMTIDLTKLPDDVKELRIYMS